jgi:hypothetical protein
VFAFSWRNIGDIPMSDCKLLVVQANGSEGVGTAKVLGGATAPGIKSSTTSDDKF